MLRSLLPLRQLSIVILCLSVFTALLSIADAADEFLVQDVPKTGSGAPHGGIGLSAGVPITPELARTLFQRLTSLQEGDGCRLTRFDTARFFVTIGIVTPTGIEHALDLAIASGGSGAVRTIGDWVLAVPSAIEPECGVTLAAIKRELKQINPPSPVPATFTPARTSEQRTIIAFDRRSFGYSLLAGQFVLLVLGTLGVLFREAKAQRPPPYAMATLLLVWTAALTLRLSLSPRTFLHEYYHVAETVHGYLIGSISAVYGDTGPALFRFVAAIVGRAEDVQVIFFTNAVLSSLAIPVIAMLDLAIVGSWPRALCAAALLCVLPQHLRFSAAEEVLVQAVTFGMWALSLWMLYLRTHRLGDVLLCVLALSLAMQTRPEMLFFPFVPLALLLLAEPHSWRILGAWRTLLAITLLVVLLIPHLLGLQRALQVTPGPTPNLPGLVDYLTSIVLFRPGVTPPIYWVLVLVGLGWGIQRKPGPTWWAILVFFGYTLFSLTVYNNPAYNLRTQLLPICYTVLIAAGAASAWMEWWGPPQRRALQVGAAVLAVLGAAMVAGARDFVTEMRDQQLEWAFLDRTVPQLPQQATLLTAVDLGGPGRLNAFPSFLLQRDKKRYELIDLRRVVGGEVAWPEADAALLYYQGMFCYFASPSEPTPNPIRNECTAVHERYVVEPLAIEELNTEGYSPMRYAPGPFRIGFFRLTALRQNP